MPKSIRILACGFAFALGVGMLLLGSAAAHATPTGQPGGGGAAVGAVPSGGANTGGGGSIGGGGPNVPLVAGGSALAIGSAGLGLFAYRRYRKTAA